MIAAVLEVSFVVFVLTMSAAAGLFGLYVLVQLFRNPGVRARKERT